MLADLIDKQRVHFNSSYFTCIAALYVWSELNEMPEQVLKISTFMN